MVQQKKKIGGVELAWEEAGHGVPVVLLHAFPLDRRMWEPQRDALGDRYRILLPDFRGFGGSSLPDEESTMERLAEDVRGLLDELRLVRVLLGGLSMGGYVAFAFLRRYPERVAGLILADTRAGADTEEGRQARLEMAALAERVGAATIAERLLPKLLAPSTCQSKPEVVNRVREIISAASPAAIAAAQRGMAARTDSSALLPQIRCPTLVIVGEEDSLTPPTEAEKLAQAIPNARLEKIPRAAHLATLEQPVHFSSLLHDFLATLPAV